MSAEARGWLRVGAVLLTYATIGALAAFTLWGVINLTVALAHVTH